MYYIYVCLGVVCGCACGGVFLFLNFILFVNVRNDLIKKITNYKKKNVDPIFLLHFFNNGN